MSVHTAVTGPLKEMQEGRLGEGCRPNADTYNAITQVRIALHCVRPAALQSEMMLTIGPRCWWLAGMYLGLEEGWGQCSGGDFAGGQG